jgi:pSer/pThr/pTyr-binding forkhead associated (FHA) protein
LSGCGDRDLPAEDHVCPGCGARTGQPLARYRLTRLRLGKEETVAELSGDSVIIGKDDRCDVVIDDDEFVSRRHSRVSRSDGTFFLEDLGSSNGTLLRIRRSIILEAGDEIVIGTTTLRLVQIP